MQAGTTLLTAFQVAFSGAIPPFYRALVDWAGQERNLGLGMEQAQPLLDRYGTDGDHVGLVRGCLNPHGHSLTVSSREGIALWRDLKDGSWIAEHRNEWGNTRRDIGPWPIYSIYRFLIDIHLGKNDPPMGDLAMEHFLDQVDPMLGHQWRLMGWADQIYQLLPDRWIELADRLKGEGNEELACAAIDLLETIALDPGPDPAARRLVYIPKRIFTATVEVLKAMVLEDPRREVAEEALLSLDRIGSSHPDYKRGLAANTALGEIARRGSKTEGSLARMADQSLVRQFVQGF